MRQCCNDACSHAHCHRTQHAVLAWECAETLEAVGRVELDGCLIIGDDVQVHGAAAGRVNRVPGPGGGCALKGTVCG